MKTNYKSLKSTILVFVLFFSLQSVSFAHFGSKGPYGGTVTCAITDANNTVFLGTANGAVFESTNNALVGWKARPVGLKSGKITALAYTGSYLFASTSDSGVYIFNGYIGVDRYWMPVNSGITNLHITSLVAIDSITLLAGTNGGGIFKTTNKGATWTDVSSTLMHYNIKAFTKAGSRIIHTSDGGVWASDDNGSTWFDFNDITTDDVNMLTISYNDTTGQILIADDMGMVYIADSASSTLTPAYTDITSGLPTGSMVRSASNDGLNWYLASDQGVYTTASSTINWMSKNGGLTTLDVNAIVPFNANLVCGTNEEGIFQTAAGVPNWTQNNVGFNNLKTYSVVTSGATLVVAATEKGVYVSNDLANSYTRANSGLTDSLHVNDLIFFGSKLYAATTNGGVFVSADTGATWMTFNTGLGTNMEMKQVVASSSFIYTYNSAGEVYVSDGSASWSAIQTGLPSGVEPTSIAIYNNTVWIGTTANGVYKKTEGSGSWAAANSGLTNMHVTALTAAEGKVYAGTDGNGVFVSNASSVSWSATAPLSISFTTTMNLDGSHVEAMAAYAGYVFASYRGGLLATADSGATWVEGGTQFNLPSYTAVNKISFVTTRVFVTTEYNSLYSNSLSELDLNSTISSYADATCNGTCNGVATITPAGGSGQYTYLWSNGETTATVSNLCAQTYTVTVTDGNLATSVRTVTIGQPSAMMSMPSSTTSTTGTDGSASVAPIGGFAPYTYSWSNGGTTATISGIGAGDYIVTITDSKNCSITDTVTVTGVVGVEEIQKSISRFAIYPNPNNGNFTLDLSGVKAEVKSVDIYDITGKLMESVAYNSVSGSQIVSVNYPAGVYYIQLNTNSGKATKKLIVQ